jgi:hypothetical protein
MGSERDQSLKLSHANSSTTANVTVDHIGFVNREEIRRMIFINDERYYGINNEKNKRGF